MAREPVRYSDELADEILGLLAEGKTLTTVCRMAGMPTLQCVRGWVARDHHGFAARYRDARFSGATVWVDEHKDSMDACDTEDKARILDSKTRALKTLIPVVAPTLLVEQAPPPQEHRITFDFGNAPPIEGRVVRTPPILIEGQAREITTGGGDGD